jgi:hypothetical protein
MATENQITANRENATKSHGPVTEAGKAAVRLNALKHGLRARQVVLPTESQEEFDQLCQDFESEWQPQTPTEQACLEQMVVHQWKLARAQRHEAWAYSLAPDDPARSKQLLIAFQFQLRWEAAFQRALRSLQKLQKDRRLLVKEAAAEKAAEAAEAAPPVDPHPPRKPWFMTCKREDGTAEKVVMCAGELWNSQTQEYQRVFDPRLTYMNSALPKIIPDPENPTPEANDPAA